jgi:hypothetical protein
MRKATKPNNQIKEKKVQNVDSQSQKNIIATKNT